MKIDSLKELKQVIELCRKSGVDLIKIDNIELVLGNKFDAAKKPRAAALSAPVFTPGGIDENLKIPVPELTEEQLMFGSSDPAVWSEEQ